MTKIPESLSSETLPAVLSRGKSSLRTVAPYHFQDYRIPTDKLRLSRNEVPALYDPNWAAYPSSALSSIRHQLAKIWNADEAHVLPTRGAEEAIDFAVRAFCEAGDEVLIPAPSFDIYARGAKLNGATPIIAQFYQTSGASEDWSLRFEKLKEQFTERTKVVFFCNPNNPTSELIDQHALAHFVTFVDNRALVVIDEAYIDFCPLSSLQPLIDSFSNVVIIRSLSKAWGAAGLRIGGLIGHPAVIRWLSTLTPAMPFSRPQAEAIDSITNSRDLMCERVRAISSARERLLEMLDQLQKRGILESYLAGPTNFVLLTPVNMRDLLFSFEEHRIEVRVFKSTLRVTIPVGSELDSLLHCLNSL